MPAWNRRKSLDTVAAHDAAHSLKRTLNGPQLVALGVGAIVGTGIYTLIGVGAGLAGPALILSFAIAGAVCVCAALAYTELATLIPASGSAYTYSYVVLGELLAWIVGWSLILEYTVVCSAVAVGWSGYASGVIKSAGWPIPDSLLVGPAAGGIINVPAVMISLAVAGLLALGTRESATVNFVLVAVKLLALGTFIALALPAFDAGNFEPFMPYGFASVDVDGAKRGVMAAAALIFFAFYGFDAVSTAAEETRNPSRDLKVGIIGSMALCTLIYMAVGAVALGASPHDVFSESNEPLAFITRSLGHPLAATLIAGAAVLALPTVILAFMYGQSRIFFVMARDGLLPNRLSRVNPRSGTPILMTIITGLIVATIAGFLPLKDIAELANAGTLCAFIAVAVCMMVLRVRDPGRPRIFKTPLPWLVGPLAVIGCVYLFVSLPEATLRRFLIWNLIGLAVYFIYARHSSRLR
jgi:basic amino acid/polyamine antiporter, APA family